ncbi:hypothetical protein [Saccharopolyspora taberi]|uniref:Uncharacterized protein n=1 Tax=Saccharopolyspora taberi TaxID=60895 RepID=A0ABN3VHP2_9PSEU
MIAEEFPANVGRSSASCRPHRIDAVDRLAAVQGMTPSEFAAADEHRYVAADGTVLSIRPEQGRLQVWLYNDCGIPAVDRASLPQELQSDDVRSGRAGAGNA